MQARRKVIISFAVLIALLAGMYFFTDWFSRTVGYFTGEEQKVRLVECLNEKDSFLYTSSNCPDCREQEEIIGQRALERLNAKVDCETESYLCKNLTAIPAWRINGEVYYGAKDVNQLGEISGCASEE